MPADTSGGDGSLERLASDPHRRFNPLIDEWVLVSAGRARRPWLGAEEPAPEPPPPAFDPGCYLCPGNPRASGDVNPAYAQTFVFTNDFSALRPNTAIEAIDDGLLRAEGERGLCRVLCFSPRHDLTLGRMSVEGVRSVIDLWAEQTDELGATYRWVQVFENRGEAMGASNPHPHGQIWAGTALPNQAHRELAAQRAYVERRGRRLLLDYAERESGGDRVVVETDTWLAVVPFWAAWPFEVLLIPTVPASVLSELDAATRDDLAGVLRDLLGRYDGLFRRPFPYSMGWHQAPFGGTAGEGDAWQLHAHVYPPLLRESVRKFMVGYELLAETQRDLTPEEAASRLRAVSASPADPAPPGAAPSTALDAPTGRA